MFTITEDMHKRMSEQDKLLPCPFCGGIAGFFMDRPQGLWGHVSCSKCHARLMAAPIATDSFERAKQRAIAAWNTRTPAPTVDDSEFEILQEENWMLEEECERLKRVLQKMNGHIAALKRLGAYSEQTYKATKTAAGECEIEKPGLRSETLQDCRENGENSPEENKKEMTQPEDLVDRVASKLWHSTPSQYDMSWSELVALSKDNLSLMATVSEFLTMAKAAIAAMQPAIDKARAEAKAEERARVAEFVRTHDVVLNSHQGHVVVPHTGNLVNMHHQKLAEAIERGGGDEDR